MDFNNEFIWNNKGIIYELKQKYKESLFCFEEALKLQPEFKEANLNKQQILLKLQEIKEEQEEHMKKEKTKLLQNDCNFSDIILDYMIQLERFLNKSPLVIKTSYEFKSYFHAFLKFQNLQHEIRQIKTNKELEEKQKLIEERNEMKKEFVHQINLFIKYLNSLNLIELREKYEKNLSEIEDLVELTKSDIEIHQRR